MSIGLLPSRAPGVAAVPVALAGRAIGEVAVLRCEGDLDLAAVDAVDLEALQLLVRLDQALEAHGHSLRLRRPTPALLRVVAGAGLLDALPLSIA